MDNDYFRKLVERVGEASNVSFREVALDGRRPQKNDCHGNVDAWAQAHPESKAVRGWLFWKPEYARYMFIAHSVVETNGKLLDITPIDESTPREHLLFLRHEGAEADFLAMKDTCSNVLYPPITFNELGHEPPIDELSDLEN